MLRKRAVECLGRIGRGNAFVHAAEGPFDKEVVIKRASDADERWKGGKELSAIDGMTIAVKDNFCVRGAKTTAGSRMLEDFVAPYSATVVERLESAGAVFVGKTNLDEFGMGSFGTNSYFGATTLPDRGTVAGGSSSGSAAAVALGACDVAIGSDTGGSVRLPAAYCNVVGLKPTYGRVSRWGLISYASSLDTPGILANNVRDAFKVLQVIAGPDPLDATCIDDVYSFGDVSLAKPTEGEVRVGIPRECFVDELPEKIIKACQLASQSFGPNAKVEPVSIPSIKHALPAYYVISSAEASSNLARYDGVQYGHRTENTRAQNLHEEYTASRTEGFGDEVKRRILMGAYSLSSEAYDDFYVNATLIRHQLCKEFAAVFRQVDVLVTPVSPFSAPTLEKLRALDPVEGYLTDVMTVPVSLAGLPAISVPSPINDISVQLIAAHGNDRGLLEASLLYETETT